MSTDPYKDILNRAAAELTPEQQAKLANELYRGVARKSGGRTRITDLDGLGKEVWEGIDPDEYLAKERNSWDG